jgi:RNA polymerase sigma-70 factor (ECF subfamily)
MQQTFPNVFQTEGRISISPPRAFLFKTVRSLALNELSKRRTRRTDAIADLDVMALFISDDASWGTTPERQANNEQQLNLTMDAVNQMSPRVKEVFILAKLHRYR